MKTLLNIPTPSVLVISLALALLALAPARAELLLYEPFEPSLYTAKNFASQAPDVRGFASGSTWGSPGNGVTFKVVRNGLSVAGFESEGGALFCGVNKRLNFQTNRTLDIEFDDTPEELFFAYVVERSETDSDGAVTLNFTREAPGVKASPMSFGIAGQEYRMNFNTTKGPKQSTTSGAGYTAGESVLLVLHLVIDEAAGDDDTWHLYANPQLAGTEKPAEPVLSGSGQLWQKGVSLNALQPRVADATRQVGDWKMDEIRVTTDVESLGF